MQSRFVSGLIILFSLFSFLGGGALDAAAAEVWYAKSSKTKVTAKPSGRAKTVGYLRAGQAVQVIEKKRRFFKISAGNTQGYVFKFKLTRKAPAGGAKGGGGLGALFGQQKMAAAESSSASSIRGLSPISEKYAKGQGISSQHVQAVKQMESLTVSDAELDRFQEEGGLGPYGP